ncbi:MAG: FmdB family zinc ribbon protein [Steroidobacteraceae bacterium]
MPIYDYACTNCHRNFELLVISSAVPACPHCGGTRLQMLMSAPAAPGKSVGVMAAGRARAARAGHTSNYRRSNGKIVD